MNRPYRGSGWLSSAASLPALGLWHWGSLLAGRVLQGWLQQLQQPAHSNEHTTTRRGNTPAECRAPRPWDTGWGPWCVLTQKTPGVFLPSRRFDIPQKTWCRACPSLQPLSWCEHFRSQRGCSTCRDPTAQAPQLQPRGGEDPTPPLLEEELGSGSSPEGSHPEALFAAASVRQGLPVVQGQYLSQSSLCWALHHISCHFWKE